jgi:hypothetical protein
MMQSLSSNPRLWPYPLPPSPIKGEVQGCGFDAIVPQTPGRTSPLAGEAGRGVATTPISP